MKKVLLSISLFLCFMGSAFAQDAQISFDENNKVLVITQQIESKAKLFQEFDNFREAVLFQTGANSYLLEITYLKDSRLVRDKRVLNEQELTDLRNRFSESEYFKRLDNRINQEGRRSFLTTTTGWATLYYGYAIPMSLEFGPRATLGTYMLMSGLSFYAPFVSTANTEITKSMAYLTYYGATRSYLHGIAIYGLAVGDKGIDSFKGIVLSATATSLTEMMLGYSYARNKGISEGRAQALGLFMDYGLFTGFATSMVLSDESIRFTSLMALAGTGLGMVLGSQLTLNEDKSVGDVSVMYSTTVVGGLIANALGNSMSDNGKVRFASSIIGSSLGLYYGNHISKSYDFSDTQGSYIRLSSFAGYLTGLGASYVFFGEINDNTINPYLLMSSLGAAGGYYVMFNYFKDKAYVETKKSAFNLDFSINPLGIAGAFKQSNNTNPAQAQLFGNWGSLRVSF